MTVEQHARRFRGTIEMPSPVSSEPAQPGLTIPGLTIYVGQDAAGHWLVQDSAKRIEGRFVSYAAAMSFAQAEREIYHADVTIAAIPLVPLVSFAPAAAGERAIRRAA